MLALKVKSLKFRVSGFRKKVKSLEFRVSGFRTKGFGGEVYGVGLRTVQSEGFGAYGVAYITPRRHVTTKGFGARYATSIIRNPQNRIGNYLGPYISVYAAGFRFRV